MMVPNRVMTTTPIIRERFWIKISRVIWLASISSTTRMYSSTVALIRVVD